VQHTIEPASHVSPMSSGGSNAAASTAEEGMTLLRRRRVWISLPRAATAARLALEPGGSASDSVSPGVLTDLGPAAVLLAPLSPRPAAAASAWDASSRSSSKVTSAVQNSVSHNAPHGDHTHTRTNKHAQTHRG